MAFDPSRLYSSLLNTGLQVKDNALYQVIRDLIGQVSKLASAANSSSGSSGSGSSTVTEDKRTFILGLDGSDGYDGFDGLPGPAGKDGIIGRNGTIGPPGMDGIDGVDGQDGISITGPAGVPGINGTFGKDGPPGVDGLDGEIGEQGIPGPIGPQGNTGPAGISGTIGRDGSPGIDAEEIEPIVIMGPPGPTGNTGLQGIPGVSNVPGPMGPAGYDADDPEMPYIIPGPPGRGLSNLGGSFILQSPANAALTAANMIAGAMFGLASGVSVITPVSSGIIHVIINGFRDSVSTVGAITLTLRYGTGLGPANAAALTGTVVITQVTIEPTTSDDGITLVAFIQGLTINTPVWIDIGATGGSSTLTLKNVTITAFEYSSSGLAQFLGGIPGIDAEDPEYNVIPGPRGSDGNTGAQGIQGIQGIPGPTGIDGEEAEFPYLIPGPTGPAGTPVMTKFTKDLGVARSSGTFDITGLTGLIADKVVTIVQTADAIVSKGNARDEFEMDNIQLTGYTVDAATIRAYWNAPNIVVGTYAFAYMVNG